MLFFGHTHLQLSKNNIFQSKVKSADDIILRENEISLHIGRRYMYIKIWTIWFASIFYSRVKWGNKGRIMCKCFRSISQLETRPLIGWPSESTNKRPGFQLTYASKTLAHDPAPMSQNFSRSAMWKYSYWVPDVWVSGFGSAMEKWV